MPPPASHLSLMDERGSQPDPFSGIGCPALEAALRKVSAEWAPRWAATGDGEESSLHEVLLRLALRLDDGTGERAPASPSGTSPDTSDPYAELRLLAAIRRNVLEQSRAEARLVDTERLLELLYSVDLLSEELSTGGAEDLDARLAEPDAFRLVAEVAHDLRSPLTSILFLSEALRNGHSGSVTRLQQRQLGLIYSAALGLTAVANDLMTIAQERTADHFEEPIPFSLHEAFESVREMLAPMAEEKRIELRFEINCFDHRVGHPGPLGRVLLNLATNALKFTREGGTVDVVANPVARDKVEISVRDTGRGIPPEQLARLFQPFQKSHGRQGYFFAASGLGLSIVRRLLESMETELEIESEVGLGTRFSFVLRVPTPR